MTAEKAAVVREYESKAKEEAMKNRKRDCRICYTKMCSRSYI